MTEIVIEPLDDGAVLVRGLPVEEVRRRLIPRSPGRPAADLIPADRILEALAELRLRWLPITERWLADQVGCSRRQLRKSIAAHWRTWSEMPGVSDEATLSGWTA